MSKTKLLGLVIGLTLVILFVAGCGSSPVTTPVAEVPAAASTSEPPTATPVPPTPELPSATSIPGLTLYLCASGKAKELTTDCAAKQNEYSTANLHPKYPNTKVDFVYKLGGDIQGTSYTFNLWLASGGKSKFDASLIVQHAGAETVIASTSFTVTSNKFTLFTDTVSGADPTTSSGDVLILRIFPASGAPGGVISKAVREAASYITIPTVK